MSTAAPLDWVDVTLREIIAPPIGSGATTDQIVEVAREVAACGAICIEALDPLAAQRTLERWGESPWDRLRAVVRLAGRASVGIYIAGRTLMGDRPLGSDIVRRAVLGAAESGATRVRTFDPLNHADAMEAVAEAAREAGIRFVPTLHVGPAPDGADELWVGEARAMAGLPGVDAITVADGGGHLSPMALGRLVRAVAEATGLPVEVAVVSTGGTATPSALAAIEAGARAVHAAVGAAALVSGRPSVETLRAALIGTPRSLTLDRRAIARAADAVLPAFSGEVLRQAAAAANGPALGLNPRLAIGLGGRLSRLGVGELLSEAADETVAVARDCGGLIVMHPFGEAIVAQAAEHVASGERWARIEPTLADALVGRWGALRGPVLPAASDRAQAAAHQPSETVTDLAAVRADAPVDLAEEDVILWAQFPEITEQLIARRTSIGDEAWHEASPALDRDLLQTLVSVMEESGGVEVSVELHGARVTARPAGAAAAVPGPGAAAAAEPADAHAGLTQVTSPIVGTFYRAPSPEADPFVSEGTRVAIGDVLCLVEAMKIYNEITAETAGVVRGIAVENGEPVEFGQLLFLIEP